MRLAAIGCSLAVCSCAPIRTAPTPGQTGSLVAVVVDQPTGRTLGGTLASVRPGDEPFESSRKFSPIDMAGVLRIDGLALGRYGVHLKRIGYFQKDTILSVGARPVQAVISMQRDTLPLH